MLENFTSLGSSEKKLMQSVMLSTLEYVLDVGLDDAILTVLEDNPDLTIYPKLQKYAYEKEAAV